MLTLSYKSKQMAIFILQGFLHHWKKRRDMFSECNAAHLVGCVNPLQIVMAVWHTVFKNVKLLGRVWQPAADNSKKVFVFQANITIR